MKITDNIHLLKIDFSVQITPEKSLPRFVNSFIVFGETITVIDCGVSDSHSAIYKYIEQNQRKISDIGTLILSHSHPDHIGSANRIKRDTGCKVVAHILEKEWIENIDLQFKQRPVPGFYTLVREPVLPNTLLIGGEELTLTKDITIRIINLPGHSKGSFGILFVEDEILFTADAIPLENDIPTYDNFRELRDSITCIKSEITYKTLLSSWTTPLYEKSEIISLIERGEAYLNRLDKAVRENYVFAETRPLENCSRVIEGLGLPALFINPLVDKAFRSHI